MMMRIADVRGAAVTVVAIGLTALSMTACGASSEAGQTGGAPASGAASSSSAASAQGATSTGSTHRIDVCAVLPAATAAKLSGLAVTIANTLTPSGPEEYGCGYTNDGDSVQFEVKIFEHNAAQSYDFFVSGTKQPTIVNGVGDKAFFDNDGTMYVLKGNRLIQVNGVKTADQCAAVARPIVAAL
jgi:hypothetical protein